MKLTVREINGAINLMQTPALKNRFSNEEDQRLIRRMGYIIDFMLSEKIQELDFPCESDSTVRYIKNLSLISEDLHKNGLLGK